MSARDFWHKLEARSESNLYFALAFLPASQREAFRDVYRFLRAADDEVDADVPESHKRAALDMFRAQLDAVFSGAPPAHPFAQRLAATVRRLDLPRHLFDTVLDALAEDMARHRIATRAELLAWCEKMSSTLGYLSLHILGARSPGAMAYARDMGVALQLCNILRDVDEDAARGQLYLPEDLLAAHGVVSEDVLARRGSAGLRSALAELAGEARSRMRAARRRLGDLPGHEQTALTVPEIWADVYLASLDRLAAVGFDPFAGDLRLPRRRKLRIAMARWLKAGGQRVLRRVTGVSPSV